MRALVNIIKALFGALRFRRVWPRCTCGQLRVARGTAVELGNVRHSAAVPCHLCDAYGRPL